MVVLCAPEQLRVCDHAFVDFQCPNHCAVSCQNCPVYPLQNQTIVVTEKEFVVPDQFVVVAQKVTAEKSGLSVADCSVVVNCCRLVNLPAQVVAIMGLLANLF